MSHEQLNEVLVSMEEVKAQIADAKLLEELHNVPAFKKLILEDYFETEAQNLVAMMAHPMNEMTQKQVTNKMVGISGLRAYFNMISRKAETAKSALVDHEETVTQLSEEME